MKQEGINLRPNKIRNLASKVGKVTLSDRVNLLLDDVTSCPLENQRVLINVNGGRLRQGKTKRGPIPKGYKQNAFHTEWIEPKLFAIYVIDEEGELVKEMPPLNEL